MAATEVEDRQWSVKWRPKVLDEIVGNKAAATKTASFLTRRNAHAVLFSGKSGCGKSTLARIAANELTGGIKADLVEYNLGSARGIEDIRSIVDQCRYLPKGKCRVVLLEEAHALTAQAKSAFLRPLEDPPHNKLVFLLCTDRPWLLDQQILNRTLSIQVNPPTEEEMVEHLLEVVRKEKAFPTYNDKAKNRVCVEIARASECVPRAALQMLQAAAGSYKQYESSKELIVQSIRQSGDLTLDQAALKVVASLYSKQKDLGERIEFLTKVALMNDLMGLLNRVMFINYHLLLAATNNSQPVGYYFTKELKNLDAIPKVSAATKVAMALATLKNSLTTVNMDPAQVILPTLIQLTINLSSKEG